MKRSPALILFLAFISVVSGYLLSKASLIGKVGMSVFYREYNFLKIWWKGALLIFVCLIILFTLHRLVQKRLTVQKAKAFHWIACLIALTSLYFSYDNFRHSLSHRLLGERFHLGVYLFWFGWIVICLTYILHHPGKDETASGDGMLPENDLNLNVSSTRT